MEDKIKVMIEDIIVYTDGSCLGNPGKGGWAAIILMDDNTRIEITGSDPYTTNNKMELTAVIKALETLHLHKISKKVKIYSDSMYVIKGITEWIKSWKERKWKKVLNVDLWKYLDELVFPYDIEWIWVKAHNNNVMNNKVDELARRSANLA